MNKPFYNNTLTHNIYFIIFAKNNYIMLGTVLIPTLINSIPHYYNLVRNEFREHRKDKKTLKQFWRRSRRRFFFPQSLLKNLLGTHDYDCLSSDKYIDYSKGVCNEIYSNEIMHIKIRYHGEIHEKPLPYKEIINYTQNPDASIKFAAPLWGPKFQLPPELDTATRHILYQFKKDRPRTEDNPAVGIYSLHQAPDGNHECLLKRLTYFDAVRTNQTLDMALDLPGHLHHTTMRQKDIGPNGMLPAFDQSLMANQIGVAAIWYMHCDEEHHKDQLQFFLKARRSKLGVFTKMMSTVSGTAQPPQGGFADFGSLEEYATSEMLRIFNQTTNIAQYMEDCAYPKQDIEITKLAFTRELMRGGLPQFFFLIKTPYISDWEFSDYYRYSLANQRKYRNGLFSNVLTPNISPETAANFLFAFRHLQRNRHLGYIDLDD